MKRVLNYTLVPFFAGTVYGVTLPVLTLMMENRQVSPAVIGWLSSFPSLGTFLAIIATPWIYRRIGFSSFLRWVSRLTLLVVALYPLIDHTFTAFAVRFAHGILMGWVWILAENCLVRVAPKEKRVLWIGIMSASFMMAIASGPLILALVLNLYQTMHEALSDMVSMSSWLTFIPAGRLNPAHALALLLIIVLDLLRHVGVHVLIKSVDDLPAPQPVSARALLQIIRRIRAPLVATCSSGALEITFISLGPLYLLRSGYGEENALALTSSFFLGGAVLLVLKEWLRGTRNDIASMMRCMALIFLISVILPWLVPLGHGAAWLLVASMLALLGALTYQLYILPLSWAASQLEDQDLIYANAAMIFAQIFGMGLLPPISGWLMGLVHYGFPLSISLMMIVCLILCFRVR